MWLHHIEHMKTQPFHFILPFAFGLNSVRKTEVLVVLMMVWVLGWCWAFNVARKKKINKIQTNDIEHVLGVFAFENGHDSTFYRWKIMKNGTLKCEHQTFVQFNLWAQQIQGDHFIQSTKVKYLERKIPHLICSYDLSILIYIVVYICLFANWCCVWMCKYWAIKII